MKYYIIIPAYNEEAFMSLTLQSLVEQTVLPTKIVVVNDNSTDKTPEIEAIMRRTVSLFEQYVKLNPRMPMEISISVSNIQEPSKLADTIASHISIKNNEKISIIKLQARLKLLTSINIIRVNTLPPESLKK